MNAAIPPETLWRDRLDELERDFKRLECVVNQALDKKNSALGGQMRLLLSRLSPDLTGLKKKATGGGTPDEHLKDLRTLRDRCRDLSAMQLELLGGATVDRWAFDGGAVEQTHAWLDGLREAASLTRKLVVITGDGRALEPGIGVTRVPFLELDLWSMPLSGRALGLLAAEELQETKQLEGEHFRAALAQLTPLIQNMRAGAPPQVAVPKDWPRQYLHHLYADMFATAVLGPIYPLATFILELDYNAPERLAREETPPIGYEDAPGWLPAPIQRAAAMLATLHMMDKDDSRPWYQNGPYHAIRQDLQALWVAVVPPSPASGGLPGVGQQLQSWFDLLLEPVLRRQVDKYLPKTQAVWEWAEGWYGSKRGPAVLPMAARPERHTAVLSAIWRARLGGAERPDDLVTMATMLLAGQPVSALPPQAPTSQLRVVVEARLERLDRGWQRLAVLLRDERVPLGKAEGVSGRFYQLLNRQVYDLEQQQARLHGAADPGESWRALAPLQDSAGALRREALDFLGGLLIRQDNHDREPPTLTGAGYGPSICALSDQLLRGYARRTGVDWSGHTVAGPDAFLQTQTDVIRLRFPDWSLWNLPLMAHEFGHKVGAATRDFRQFKNKQVEKAKKQNADPAQVGDHLEEFFADMFATYALGPAFACAAILVRFQPDEAQASWARHPTHDERVRLILYTLEQMNDRAHENPNDHGSYAYILHLLEDSWDLAVQAAGTAKRTGAAADSRREQVDGWGKELYERLDRCYRLGAGYTAQRWDWARAIAPRFQLSVPSVQELRHSAKKHELGELRLDDVLNALWWAQLTNDQTQTDLTQIALQLGQGFLEM